MRGHTVIREREGRGTSASEREREYAKEHAGAELCDYVHTDLKTTSYIHTCIHIIHHTHVLYQCTLNECI